MGSTEAGQQPHSSKCYVAIGLRSCGRVLEDRSLRGRGRTLIFMRYSQPIYTC